MYKDLVILHHQELQDRTSETTVKNIDKLFTLNSKFYSESAQVSTSANGLASKMKMKLLRR